MKPYRYQERVYEHLLARRNVIIQAPTGAGKTRAALYPFLENLERYSDKKHPADAPLPLTCRYAVPMRVLATQFEREYRERLARMDQKRATRLADLYVKKLGIKVPAIQTGETPEDPRFESPLTFCTIDQLLASFIGTPYSIGLRQANLNVGAVIGSYLILDEFHLYPLEKTGNGARMTTLAMLRLLKGLSPFVLMTATFSTKLLSRLGELLNAKVVQAEGEQELQEIMQGRRRTIRQENGVMTPEAILAAHGAARERHAGASLVVCNTVARAQEIYRQLREALEQRGERDKTRLILLHSRFTPADRKEKSKELEDRLGDKQWEAGRFHEQDGKDVIVVGTQVVEVGLNISAGVLHTELAPANSIIQRAGRCGRFAQQQGEVIVYQVPPHEDGKVSYLPYDDELCEKTWEHLGEMIAQCGELVLPFGFTEEQALIDAVHTDEDAEMLRIFERDEGRIKREIMSVLERHDPGKEGELIRDVRQVAVVIHPTPEESITTKPFTWESFSLRPGTLMGAWKALDERRRSLGFDAPEWVMKQLIAVGDATGAEEEDSRREQVYTWDNITNVSQISSALRVALPPELATYDADLGFRLLTQEDEQATGWQSAQVEPERPDRGKSKRVQRSYVEHITGLLHAYEWSVQRELAWVTAKLGRELSLAPDTIDEAVRLAIACHDIGKLGKAWQQWARDWQALLVTEIGNEYAIRPEYDFLAKTDGLYPPKREWAFKKAHKVKALPHHACAGVIASAMLIAQRLAGADQQGGLALTRAALSAIARHHAPTAATYQAITWDEAAKLVIQQALEACRLPTDLAGLDLSARQEGIVANELLIKPGYDSKAELFATWLGFVLARALRLCDQRAEKEW
jgi:CRISPR-associated endonuclease/helicase Cas3